MHVAWWLILPTTFVLSLLIFTLVWRIHVAARDASIVDYVWGPGFLAIALTALAASGAVGGTQILFFLALAAWATRLTVHVVRRHRRTGEEDGRYRRLRDKGGAAFWWKSLFTVFLLQAVLQWLIALPVIAALGVPASEPRTAVVACGIILFAIGFILEWLADTQLARHKADPATATTVLERGLWAWSRHPNYVGEIVLWWGLGLAAFGISGSAWAFVGPAVLTLVVRTVSVRLTDEQTAARPDFSAYRARTSALVPWPPRPTH